MTEATRGFCRHQNFVPVGCLPLTCSYVHLLNHEKMCIKSEAEEILFKLATNDHSDSFWHKNFGLNGLSDPAQGLCLNFFSSITADFNISSALRWSIQDQWSSGYCIVGVWWGSVHTELFPWCFDKIFAEMFVELLSTKYIILDQTSQFDWLPWQPIC